MGLDALMEFTLTKPLTDQELRLASGRLFAIFNQQGPFWLEKKEGQHILEVVEDSEENRYKINLIGRYYGTGYERGPILDYIVIADWLEFNLGATVFYGNDSSDYLKLFDAKARRQNYLYFLEKGHEPYRAYSLKDEETPKCSFCGGKPFHECGGGGARTFWHCDGCSTNLVTEPNKEPIEVERF